MAKVKKLDPLSSGGMQDVLSESREALTGGPSGITAPSDLAPPPVDNYTQWMHKRDVESKAGFGDYFDAVNNEDGFITRGIGHLVGHLEYDPDPNWKPFEEKTWKSLSEGIPDEFVPEYQKAIQNSLNATHAQYIKDMMLSKVGDQELLSTLGTAGNIARFGYGMVSPEQLALAVGTMGASKVAGTVKGVMTLSRATDMARVASRVADPALRAEQMAKAAAAMEEAAKARGGLSSVVGGTTTAAGMGAGFETARQSVNFENDDHKILDATLFSVAFAAPFVGLGAHQMNRLTRTAAMERQVLGVMEKMHKGEVLSEAEFTKLKDYGYYIDHLKHEAEGGYDTLKGADEIRQRHDLKSALQERWAEREQPLEEKDGIGIGEDHVEPPKEEPPVVPPEAPKEPPTVPPKDFTKHWDNQEHELGVGDFIQVEKDGDILSGDVSKIGDGRILIKDADGKIHSIKPPETTLVGHDPKLKGGGFDAPAETGLGHESPPTTFDPPEAPKEPPKERTRRADMVAEGWNPKKDGKPGLKSEKWADRLVDKLKSGEAIQVKPKAILRDLASRFEGTHLGPVIKALLKSPELRTRVHLAVDHVARVDEGYGGLYWGHSRDVMVTFVNDLSKLSDKEAQTFVHEMVHAHTVHVLEGKIKNLSADQQKAVQELIDLHALVERTLKKQDGVSKVTSKTGYRYYPGDHYGMTNVAEFVSEVFSNREFQKKLAGIKVGNTTALGSVWRGIKKALGIGKEMDDSAFAKAMSLTEQLIGSRVQEVPHGSTPSIQGAEVGGSIRSMAHALPAEAAVPTGPSVIGFVDIKGKKLPIRWDISQTLDNNLNPHIRQLGFDLVKNPIGWEGDRAQGVTISERKERIRRVVAGQAHFTMKEALGEAVDSRKLGFVNRIRSGFDREFYENATRLARGDTTVLAEHGDIAGPLNKAAGALRTFYDTMGKRAMDSGLVGAENLPVGGNYINRVYLHNKIAEMAKTHGDDSVVALFASAFRNPKIKGDMSVAREFLGAIRDLQFKTEMSDLLLNAKDMETLRATLDQHGLSQSKIDSIINVMFDAKDTGSDGGMPTNLRHRMDLDETASIKTKTGATLRISDVLENDPRLLIDKYTNTMGGHIAMAEHGWIDPGAEFASRIKEADAWASASGASYDLAKHTADKQLAQDMFDHILGRPMSMQTFNRFDRFMGALRAYSRSVFLGQLGIAAAFELKNAMAMSAFHGAWSQMPTFGRVITMLRKGIPMDDQLAKDIQHIAGFGNEFAMQYGKQHQITEHSYGRGISAFERFSDKASHVVDVISGNSSFTSATRNLAAKFTVQHLYDMGIGKKSIDEGLMQRLVHNGIDRDNITVTLADLNKHSVADNRGVVQSIDWEGWQQNSPKTYGDFSLALERFTRDGIQDHNIGETMPWMHTTTGKIIAELRTFNLVAHSKQFLKNVHYHDRTSAMVFMTSFVGEAMAYALQTSLNYSHNQDELNKRLTMDRIAKAAVQRMATLGILSYVIDTPAKYVTGKSFFGEGTNNTDNRDMFMTPSLMVMKRMVGGVQTAAQGLSPLSNTVTTKQEVKDSLGVLPGINTWGARNVVDFVASHYPKSDPSQYHH